MCGIAGFIGIKKKIPQNKEIINCKLSLKRRGPDTQEFIKKMLKIVLSY